MMKSAPLLVAATILASSDAYGQKALDLSKPIMLTLTLGEVDALVQAAGSGKATWLEINPLMQKIIGQARQQQQEQKPVESTPETK